MPDLVHADVASVEASVRSTIPGARGEGARRGGHSGRDAGGEVVLRRATDADWWRYFGKERPGWWVGITAEDAHMLLGLGGVYLGTDGRFWAFFGKARGVRARLTMQKAARALFDGLREAGVREVSAIADDTIEGAEFWLTRLGFKPTDETRKGHIIWTWEA